MTSRAADFQLNLQLHHDIFYLQNPEKNILQNFFDVNVKVIGKYLSR